MLTGWLALLLDPLEQQTATQRLALALTPIGLLTAFPELADAGGGFARALSICDLQQCYKRI